MLGPPKYGWSTLTVGDFEIDVSYLTDVAVDCLKAFNEYQPWFPTAIHFDAESEGTHYLMLTGFHVFVLGYSWLPCDSETYGLKEFDLDVKDLARELYSDINSNIKAWAMWDVFEGDKFNFWKETTRNWIQLKIALGKMRRKYKLQ